MGLFGFGKKNETENDINATTESSQESPASDNRLQIEDNSVSDDVADLAMQQLSSTEIDLELGSGVEVISEPVVASGEVAVGDLTIVGEFKPEGDIVIPEPDVAPVQQVANDAETE